MGKENRRGAELPEQRRSGDAERLARAASRAEDGIEQAQAPDKRGRAAEARREARASGEQDDDGRDRLAGMRARLVALREREANERERVAFFREPDGDERAGLADELRRAAKARADVIDAIREINFIVRSRADAAVERAERVRARAEKHRQRNRELRRAVLGRRRVAHEEPGLRRDAADVTPSAHKLTSEWREEWEAGTRRDAS